MRGVDRAEMYTVNEAAKLLGLTRCHVLQLLKDGELEGERETSTNQWVGVYQHSVHARGDAHLPRSRSPEAVESPADAREWSRAGLGGL